MKVGEGKKKLRKRFFVSFLVVLAPITFFIIVFSSLTTKELAFVLAIFIGVYLSGYISGYLQGRDALREVMDFMESGLRWKVIDAENKMNDLEDNAYKESQKNNV